MSGLIMFGQVRPGCQIISS